MYLFDMYRDECLECKQKVDDTQIIVDMAVTPEEAKNRTPIDIEEEIWAKEKADRVLWEEASFLQPDAVESFLYDFETYEL